MVVLPPDPAPNGVRARLMSFAIRLRPATGGAAQLIDRPGGRFVLDVSMPAMKPDTAAAFTAALLKATREGLEMDVPLLGRSQGVTGNPVVNGAGQTGTTINLRGLLAGYAAKPGYWLTLVDAGGDKYLHQIAAGGNASAAGTITLGIEPPLRAAFPDGATVLLARPKVQGFLTEEAAWMLQLGDVIDGISFTLEEAA